MNKPVFAISQRQRRWLVVLLVTSLLLAIDSIVVWSGKLLNVDRQGWIWVVQRLGAEGFRIMEAVSLAGVTPNSSRYLMIGASLATFLVAARLFLRHMSFCSALFITDVAGAGIIVHILKLVVTRDGPSLTPWIQAGHTFPSGTAAVSVAFFGFLGYITYQTSRGAFTRLIGPIVCIVVSLAFAASAMTYHYPTEVFGGVCAGLAWFSLLQVAFWNPVRKEIFTSRKSEGRAP